MPYDRVETSGGGALPLLAPVTNISRPLSTSEYYHASIGTSAKTLDGPRYQGFFLHAFSTVRPEQWRRALEQVSAVNPELRLRLVGTRARARWQSDGVPPPLRWVTDCDWDMRSSLGAEFVHAMPLSLEQGPTVELIVASRKDGSTLVVLRSHHAVIDGIGMMHVFEELFRVLRGEPLLGSNASFSDADLMLSVGVKRSTSRHFKTQWLTGEPSGDETGDEWRRISLGPPTKNLLGRVAAAMAEFAHQRTALPALFAVPVNLRRHLPGLVSSANFSNMLMVRMDRGDTAEAFNQRLKAMLAERMDAFYPRIVNLFKQLPMTWIDRMLSRTWANYRSKRALETAVISNLGRWNPAVFSCDGFRPEMMFLQPLTGSAFSALLCFGENVEMTLNLPKVLASNGRFDELVAHLQRHLAASA